MKKHNTWNIRPNAMSYSSQRPSVLYWRFKGSKNRIFWTKFNFLTHSAPTAPGRRPNCNAAQVGQAMAGQGSYDGQWKSIVFAALMNSITTMIIMASVVEYHFRVHTRVSNGTGQWNFSGQRDRSSFIVPKQRDNGTEVPSLPRDKETTKGQQRDKLKILPRDGPGQPKSGTDFCL